MIKDRPVAQITLGFLLVLFIFYFSYVQEPLEEAPPSDLEQKLEGIKRKQKNKVSTYIKACKDGVVRGSMVGFVTGGPSSAVVSGIALGIINPVLKYFD